MSKISKENAIKLFKSCNNIIRLKEVINQNCHLWFNEDSTITMLNKCYSDAKHTNTPKQFGTFLIDNAPYIVEFTIYPNETVKLVD